MTEVLDLNDDFLVKDGQEARFINEVLNDFYICCLSREMSLLGRKEVLTGKAKFGVFGDGKEVPQVAMAKAFKKGDHLASYYRGQTFALALGLVSLEELFGQLYADPENDPNSGGRQMNAHFATPYIDQKGEWLSQKNTYNMSSVISPTAGQMGRALGLAYASKKYRNLENLKETKFSKNGNEVCFCTIGDASTSEGIFFETINAAAVTKSPLAVSIWDDGYGISVPTALQTTKGCISKVLKGFELDEMGEGIHIYKCKGWDYPSLVEMYLEGIEVIRREHIPAIFHVQDLTQPQGHSTSGSHERYKSKERLEWEKNHDCLERMATWMMEQDIADPDTILNIREEAKQKVKEARNRAWKKLQTKIKSTQRSFREVLNSVKNEIDNGSLAKIESDLKSLFQPSEHEIVKIARKARFYFIKNQIPVPTVLQDWIRTYFEQATEDYGTHLMAYRPNENTAFVEKEYDEEGEKIPGHKVLNRFFDKALENDEKLLVFGEDVGKIGGVNQTMAGLQKKYGKERVFDTGIREWSIVGKALGMAMRGLKPIAEIQYLDYLVYALPILTDDLATLRYRTDGIQQAPAIIRTRGHRLEGIWHTGSPIGMILNAMRGVHLVVPRNMTQAAGFYNTLLKGNDPAIVIEVLNGYRLREAVPSNLGSYTLPLGVPEVLKEGTDVTIVTYGACVRVAQEAIESLDALGIDVELIDVQTLLPFDIHHKILDSIKKTNKVLFLDEDVPGGASSYMMQKVLEEQEAYYYLDVMPQTLCSKEHRTPYGSDGDYYTKPSAEDVVEMTMNIMYQVAPKRYVLSNFRMQL